MLCLTTAAGNDAGEASDDDYGDDLTIFSVLSLFIVFLNSHGQISE
jgi:hypothetical protein